MTLIVLHNITTEANQYGLYVADYRLSGLEACLNAQAAHLYFLGSNGRGPYSNQPDHPYMKIRKYIYIRLTTRAIPPNSPIPTTTQISSQIPTNRTIFPTTRPTLQRHSHKWADCNVKRLIPPRQYDKDKIEMQL